VKRGMLLSKLKQELQNALKRGDMTRRDTLRYLLSAVHNAAIAKYGSDAEKKLTDSDILDVIEKQVKTHRESIEAFEKGGRADLVEKEKAELAVLAAYLPKQLSDDELRALLKPVVAQGGGFGPMMGRAMAVVKGKADGKRVADVVKRLLAQQ